MVDDLATTDPLAGFRAATTAPQEALLDRASAALAAAERPLAAWLVGRFATGETDACSELGLQFRVVDAAADDLRGDGWKAIVQRITPTVVATTFPQPLLGGDALTPDWTHRDLVFVPQSASAAASLTGIRPLFDKTGAPLPPGPVPRLPIQGDPYFPAEVVDLSFDFLGNLVPVLGRGELLLATNGTIARCDSCLVPLLLTERGIRRAGGQKRRNPFRSPEQVRLLEALPPIMPTVDAVVAGETALARLVPPRGRALAARLGARWPAETVAFAPPSGERWRPSEGLAAGGAARRRYPARRVGAARPHAASSPAATSPGPGIDGAGQTCHRRPSARARLAS
jgi:hypothetical protein